MHAHTCMCMLLNHRCFRVRGRRINALSANVRALGLKCLPDGADQGHKGISFRRGTAFKATVIGAEYPIARRHSEGHPCNGCICQSIRLLLRTGVFI
eukprot:6202502-Pleurochrysis_carterae.AAC.4